jgi:hypothetical protein
MREDTEELLIIRLSVGGALYRAIPSSPHSPVPSVPSVRLFFAAIRSFCTVLEGWITMCHSGISF